MWMMIAAIAIAGQPGAGEVPGPEGYSHCRAVLIGRGAGPATEAALRCQRPDGAWELLRGPQASGAAQPAPTAAPVPEAAATPPVRTPALPTRAEAVASMQGRPYTEVVAEQAAEARAREARAATVSARSSATPPAARGAASDLNQRIGEAFAQAYYRAPANGFGASSGLVTLRGAQVASNLGLGEVVYTFNTRNASCRKRGAVQRCTFDVAVAASGHMLGFPIPTVAPEWNRWTSDFEGGDGPLRSATIDAHMAEVAAAQLANGQSGSNETEWEMPFGDIQGCSYGFVDIC